MKITIHSELTKYTSSTAEITSAGNTVVAALEDLFNQFPQLLVFLSANNHAEADKTTIKLNGEYLFDPADNYRQVSEEDVLEFGRDIPEGENGVGKIIAGAVLIIIGVVSNIISPGNPFQAYMYKIGAVLIMGGAIDLIVGTPHLPTFDSGNSTSATYTFSGVKNTTVSGTPIPIVYGRHRVGGHILNAYIDTHGEYNYLYLQTGTAAEVPTSREATAYHEAAHAVVACLVGAQVDEVFISEIPQPAAQVLGDNRTSDEVVNGGTRMSASAQVDAFGRGLISFAGITAQMALLHHRGLDIGNFEQELTIGAQHDFDSFDAMLRSAPAGVVAQAKSDINRTLHAWFTDPAVWGAVERVAAALLERGRITGQELTALVRPR